MNQKRKERKQKKTKIGRRINRNICMKLKINLKQHMQNYNQHLNCLCEWTWSILSQCSPVICSCLKPNKKKLYRLNALDVPPLKPFLASWVTKTAFIFRKNLAANKNCVLSKNPCGNFWQNNTWVSLGSVGVRRRYK